MAKLIAEGGVAGHLAHLYDNRGLTFEKIAEILTAASKGELVGTEKTDGFNIYLGFKDGETRAARNKGDMQKGGMNAVDLAMREFAGGPEIKKVYVDAFNAFENAVASLSDEEKLAIFGPEGEIFYNSEIMGPGASNVVNYDSNIITIHSAGHKRYDEETVKGWLVPHTGIKGVPGVVGTGVAWCVISSLVEIIQNQRKAWNT